MDRYNISYRLEAWLWRAVNLVSSVIGLGGTQEIEEEIQYPLDAKSEVFCVVVCDISLKVSKDFLLPSGSFAYLRVCGEYKNSFRGRLFGIDV